MDKDRGRIALILSEEAEADYDTEEYNEKCKDAHFTLYWDYDIKQFSSIRGCEVCTVKGENVQGNGIDPFVEEILEHIGLQ